MAKKCKSKKLNLRRYQEGGSIYKLPKYDGTGLSYLDETTNMFTKQQNLDPYGSLAGNTQSQSPYSVSNLDKNVNSGYISNNQSNSQSNTQPNFNMGDVSKYSGYLNAANTIVDEWGTGEGGGLSREGTQQFVDDVGNTVGGAYYAGGKAVDELLFEKNADGTYDNQFQAQMSFTLTDPAQAVSQASNTWQEGNEWGAVAELILPGLAGSNYQKDMEADAAEQERKQHTMKMNAINKNTLNNLNSSNINYLPVTKLGGQLGLKKYANGGDLTPQEIIRLSNSVHKSLSSNSEYIPGNITRYDKKMYLTPNTGTDSTNVQMDDSLLKTGLRGGYNVTQDSISGSIPVNYYRPYTDKKGDVINASYVSSDIFDEYFPNATTIKKEQGGALNQNKRLVKKPIVRKYGGQTHEGPDEGIPVDQNGNPSAMTGRKPIALTEKGEVVYNGYVFSDSIKYKKK